MRTSTVVAARKSGALRRSRLRLSDRNRPSTNTAGTTSAVSLSQNWNACTNVIDRMPPPITVSTTTSPAAGDPAPRGQGRQRRQRQPRTLQLRQQVEPADDQHEDRAQPAQAFGVQAGDREVGNRVGPGPAQRCRHEEDERQVAGGERDREPQGVRAVAQDHPGDAEERRSRQVLARDRAGVGDRPDGARGDEEVRRAAGDAHPDRPDDRRDHADERDRDERDDPGRFHGHRQSCT